MAVLTSLVVVAVLVTSGSVEGVRLSMTPNRIIHGETSTLTIRCDTDAASDDSVHSITIFKGPSTEKVAVLDTRGRTYIDSSIQQRATVAGSTTPAAGSHLVLTFNSITCSDEGEYSCEFRSLKINTSPKTYRMLESVNDPSNIEMMARPDKTSYNVNDTVELMCTGNVGKPVTGNWTWETKHVSLEITWTPLRPGLIPEDETPHASGLCQMTGRSTLTFQVRMEDDDRMYRCYPKEHDTYSASFTIRFDANGAGCPRSEVKGKAVGAGLAVWALLTDLLILGGEGHVQRFFT